MKFAGFAFACMGMAINAWGQAPTVGGLLNNYSYTLPGLPNYGIAQGSIFDIFGTNLSSTTTPLQDPPLKTTLDGVSISVNVNGTITSPLIYFLSPGQIAAVLPSATPVGTGTITVSTTAGASAAFPIVVVESAFGLLTLNNGTGPASGFDANNNGAALGYSSAANPGDFLEFWGTGLGPTTGDGTGVALTTPLEVDIGGIKSVVQYHGRSAYLGLDQVNVQVPAGVSGCNVSVVFVTGNYVSNFATIPVTATGRTCSDTTSGITASVLEAVAKSGSFSFGVIGLTKLTTAPKIVAGVSIGGGTTDLGFGLFAKVTATQLNSGAFAQAESETSIGSCIVTTYSASVTDPTPPSSITFTTLNAGPEIDINAPGGEIPMPFETTGSLGIYTTGATTPSFIPATGGSFSFNNGTGGPDVGAFMAQIQVPAPLVWTNMSDISTVTRSAGLTINWTGGDPSTYVAISGYSLGSVDGTLTNLVGGNFTCSAAVAPGTFTVPPSVLLSLPSALALDGVSVPTGTLAVSNYANPVTFTATGLDYAYISAGFSDTISVTYQ